jgi:hypothetical protein
VIFLVASWLSGPRRPAAPRPILTGSQVPAQVHAILERSCQDCHSELTHYPWYSYVAPVSFLVLSDVEGGRTKMNLSRWSEYTRTQQERYLSEIANQVRDRDMPLAQYLWVHRGARLSDAEVEAVFRWTQMERLRLISEPRP